MVAVGIPRRHISMDASLSATNVYSFLVVDTTGDNRVTGWPTGHHGRNTVPDSGATGLWYGH